VNGVLRAGFEIQDKSRPEAAAVIKALQAQGKTVWCLSGDRPDRVSQLTAELGIEAAHALGGKTPERKQAFVANLQAQGKIVAMVGDGHNDAPVLAQADVSLAVYGAAPLAQQKADIYLVRRGLAGVMKAFGVAARSKRVLNQNLSWALVYNLLAIPFAAAGWISPLAASVGMAASSLLVVLNSARLLR
jgi:Cu2+-exporting ATPase